MKIAIFLALTLAVLYMAQAEVINAEEAQGHPLEQDHNQGYTCQELAQQAHPKHATCTAEQCTASCATRNMLGACQSVCQVDVCRCHF